MNIKIRVANKNDIKIANEFLTKLIVDEKKYDKNINDKCVIKNYYQNVTEYANNYLLLADVNNKTIGYLYGYIINNGDTCIDLVAQLDAIYIEEKYRKNNIGYMLIEQFKKWAIEKNVKYIEMGVWNNNVAAIKLYEKANFKSAKTIMSLELN